MTTKNNSTNSASADIKAANFRLVTGTLAGAAIVISLGSLALSGLALVTGGLSFFRTAFDGNTSSFTDGSSIADVAEAVSPSVVSIVTENHTSSAAGTGVIVTSDGYILTNKHVVDGAKEITVVLDNGTTYSNVTLVGTDPLNDVAFIKIKDAKKLPAAQLGDSKTLRVGQQVLAIGNALGQYQNTVTEGIISATGRSFTAMDTSGLVTERLSDMIQTDASINQGNSGGPLINAAGQVIGINTAVSSAANGIGFAIPISSIKGLLNTVISTGKAERGYIGVSYLIITADVAKEYNLPISRGAYITTDSGSVASGSPAEKAGLKPGDIITRVNDVKIGESGSLSTLLGEYSVGDTVKLTYIRDGQSHTTSVKLTAYKAD